MKRLWSRVSLSKFHAKFLGKSWPGEGEQAWHNLQSTDDDMTMDDGYDDADDELARRRPKPCFGRRHDPDLC